MITEEENNLLTQTGKGTPCGQLMRRYWQPAALSEELEADKPFAVQLFGEELVLFRDGSGKPALIGRYCAHQGVDMMYGRVEPDGLRCLYHGWLFDTCGRVLLRGDWLPEKERRWDVGQPSYPVIESGGVIYAYMGVGDAPAAPDLSGDAAAPGEIKRLAREHNYWQGIVGLNEMKIDDGQFFLPNLVRCGVLTRWLVPVDDKSHVEFLFHGADVARLAGEPLDKAGEGLLSAMRDNISAATSPS